MLSHGSPPAAHPHGARRPSAAWPRSRGGSLSRPLRLSIMAAALLFVSSSCPLARTRRTHCRLTRSCNPPGARIGVRGRVPAPLPARSATPPRGEGRSLTRVGP